MTREKNSIIVNKIIDHVILEIEALFSDKENMPSNIKVIKELTMVLKELEKLYDNETELKVISNAKERNEFLGTLFELSKIDNNKQKKELTNGKKKRKI